jgi:hypothetical protein
MNLQFWTPLIKKITLFTIISSKLITFRKDYNKLFQCFLEIYKYFFNFTKNCISNIRI